MKFPPVLAPLVLPVAILIGASSLLAQAPSGSSQMFTIESVLEINAGMVASAPKWSPDGKWIAFSAPKGKGIGIVRPDGSGSRVLTSEPGSGFKFSWSPDGSRIAFRTARREAGPRKYVIRVIEVATGEIDESSEVAGDVQPPVWQRGPVGMRWISHAASGAMEGVWRGAARAAAVGPPLLISKERGIWLHAPPTVQRKKLSIDSALNPVWSKDGGRIAYDSLDQIAVATPAEPGRRLCAGNHPAWSPDGKWIVFQITRDHTHAPDDARQHTPDSLAHSHDDKTNHRIVDSDLWIIDADGAGRHRLTNTPDVLETEPDWSPDGGSIVCGTEETGRLLILKITRR